MKWDFAAIYQCYNSCEQTAKNRSAKKAEKIFSPISSCELNYSHHKLNIVY